MDQNIIYIISAIVLVLLFVGFVVLKVAGCGFKILRFIIILVILICAGIAVKNMLMP